MIAIDLAHSVVMPDMVPDIGTPQERWSSDVEGSAPLLLSLLTRAP
jgi:hypothetical protein